MNKKQTAEDIESAKKIFSWSNANLTISFILQKDLKTKKRDFSMRNQRRRNRRRKEVELRARV